MTFLTPLKDVTIPEGQTAIFECEVSNPKQPVTWSRNGKKILKSDKRAVFTVEGATHRLTIKDAKVEDMAEFTASFGKEKTTAKLVVEKPKGLFDTWLQHEHSELQFYFDSVSV